MGHVNGVAKRTTHSRRSRAELREETELIARAQGGDQDAKMSLLRSCDGAIRGAAAVAHSGISIEDRLQEARAAVLEAIRDYDPTRRVAFRKFAHLRIKYALAHLSEQTNTISLPQQRAYDMRMNGEEIVQPVPLEDAVHAVEEREEINWDAVYGVREFLRNLPGIQRTRLSQQFGIMDGQSRERRYHTFSAMLVARDTDGKLRTQLAECIRAAEPASGLKVPIEMLRDAEHRLARESLARARLRRRAGFTRHVCMTDTGVRDSEPVARLGRCVGERGCPVRFRDGVNRRCPDHMLVTERHEEER